MSARRVVAGLLAMMLSAALVNVMLDTPRASAAPGDGTPTNPAMTLSGIGEFEKLKVTVSQTTNLTNQVVSITWQGGAPTLPGGGTFGTNYLQMMQCWGDDPAGPDRTQCQFGAANTTVGGIWVASRQLNGVPDQKETLKLPANSPPGANAFAPFWPVGGDKPTDAVSTGLSQFFDRQTTNEAPFAQTNADGTGQQFFEVQTSREAAGLGCGDPVTTGAATTGRRCWLVVVPRGTKEVTGTTPTVNLDSSPLSQSNWANRIVFPLEFVPVGQACPLSQERRVVGNELAVEAVSRWQPALCAGGGAVYNYSQVPDDVARNLVEVGQSPGLALMTNPVPADQEPPDRPLVYAPVALSGLAIAFNIERQTDGDSSAADQLLNGQRFLSMKLTPRLVAKLLTQSYQYAVATGPVHDQVPDYLQPNPVGLTVDPEFLALNPEYKGFAVHIRPPDAMVQLGGSDVTSLLWSWVKADPDANAFLAGTPDPYGMVVNPNNKGLTLPTSTFPRGDQSCIDINFSTIPPPVIGKNCTSDVHPYFNDMHAAALAASRGDSGGQTPTFDPSNVVVLKKDDRQQPGSRALLAVVDAATAVRYGLPTASLLNAAHQYVAPTNASLLAGAAAMKPSAVAGVLAADPSATDPAAYPLTALSYAVASPSTLDAAAGKEYAAFVRYAAGPGQQPGVGPGQLPFGMAPLPDPLRAQAIAAAAAIETQAGKPPAGRPSPGPSTNPGIVLGVTPGDTAGPTGGPSAPAGPGGAQTNPGGGTNTPVATPGGPGSKAPSVKQKPVARTQRTPALPAPAVGALLLTILIAGALAATSSPVLQSPALRQFGAAVLRRLRKGVTPTEQ